MYPDKANKDSHSHLKRQQSIQLAINDLIAEFGDPHAIHSDKESSIKNITKVKQEKLEKDLYKNTHFYLDFILQQLKVWA